MNKPKTICRKTRRSNSECPTDKDGRCKRCGALMQERITPDDRFMAAAQTLPEDYAKGYQRGLRRHYHGEKFGTATEHAQWMAMSDHRQEMGDGYRDGYAGNPPRGFHGNLGNLNAQGELPANSHLNIRVNSQAKAGWVKQATAEDLTLTQWVIKTLDAATK